MVLSVDDKGKYFTERISKRGLPVTVSVRGTRIQGTIHLALDHRLKDELDSADDFIALTDAKIFGENGKRAVRKTELLLINKEQIDWVCPDETDTTAKDD